MDQNLVGAVNPAQFAGASIQEQAIMLVYSPKIIPDQILRPNIYNFTQEVIEGFQQDKELVDRGVSPNFRNNDKLHSAILPSTDGLSVNTNALSQYWTFVVLLDVKESSFSNLAIAPKQRIIALGYFDQEPFYPGSLTSNPIPNPNAIMMFTNRMTIAAPTTTLSARGHNANVFVKTSYDTVGQHVNGHIATPMFAMTPADLRSACTLVPDPQDQDPFVIHPTHQSHQDIAVYLDGGALGNSNQISLMSHIHKSPRHQLAEIESAFNRAQNALEYDGGLSSILESSGETFDGLDTFDRTLPGRKQISGDNVLDPSQGCSVPTLLTDFLKTYENLVVQPIQIQRTSQWDVRPQTIASVETVMSSLLIPAVQSMANGLGLSTISFRYCSYNPEGMSLDGVWEIIAAHLVVNDNDTDDVKRVAGRFMRLFEETVTPILRAQYGEFEVLIYHDMLGQTLADLRYLDNASHGGFVEVPNQYSSFLSPNIGDKGAFTANATNIQYLYNTLEDIGIRTQAGAGMEDYQFEQGLVLPDNPIPMDSYRPVAAPEMAPMAGVGVVIN